MKASKSIYVRYLKPLLDIAIAGALLIVLAPLAILIILGYIVQGEKPIFFYQDRVGQYNKVFRIIKFRSMTTGGDGKNLIFPMGYFLRKTSLDEIPQLLNVLKQEMSLVGPRPLLPSYLDLYNNEQLKRHLMKPGITGWAQVNGRNHLKWENRFKLDLYYVNNVTFLLDLKILALTVVRLFEQNDVVPEFNKPFKGNQ